ncbi:SAICAR synthase-like protein [Xylariaceae sp. FL0255]|nr:SAICAR synthase-like protein [Xylariaceae sp. FL0255]
MARREVVIARSIVYGILTALPTGEPAHKPSLIRKILRLLNVFWLTFGLVRADVFRELRETWQITEADYRASFGAAESQLDGHNRRRGTRGVAKKKDVLKSMGDMGYSGSTFFRTTDGAYLVKSVPRHFEHDFFKNELLLPYAEHMHQNPDSLLTRITDMLFRTHHSIGEFLGLAPSHHIVMENILYGQDHAQSSDSRKDWESWDLKPSSYFFPERDIAGGALTSEATKSKLADEFDGTIKLSQRDATQFVEMLEKDTQLLAEHNAVDYSLFLVRISAEEAPAPEDQPSLESGQVSDEPIPPAQPPFAPPTPPSWRTGIRSSDGKEVYRAAILDFFWAKHTLRAKVMTGLVRSYNVIDQQGPMSITAESTEYRERFLKMCTGFIEVAEEILIPV